MIIIMEKFCLKSSRWPHKGNAVLVGTFLLCIEKKQLYPGSKRHSLATDKYRILTFVTKIIVNCPFNFRWIFWWCHHFTKKRIFFEGEQAKSVQYHVNSEIKVKNHFWKNLQRRLHMLSDYYVCSASVCFVFFLMFVMMSENDICRCVKSDA